MALPPVTGDLSNNTILYLIFPHYCLFFGCKNDVLVANIHLFLLQFLVDLVTETQGLYLHVLFYAAESSLMLVECSC